MPRLAVIKQFQKDNNLSVTRLAEIFDVSRNTMYGKLKQLGANEHERYVMAGYSMAKLRKELEQTKETVQWLTELLAVVGS